MSGSASYRAAGVDTAEGERFVGKISEMVRSTFSPHAIDNFGGFAGLYDVSFLKEYRRPLLVSGTDGVGTKLHLARLLDCHHGVGIDLVAMCANDILVTGGRAHIFLDYIACGQLQSSRMAEIVGSIAAGCRLCGASLLGGETAEHPGTMAADDYDLAGFVVGAVEADQLISGNTIEPGSKLIALPSSGIHANGLSLLRRLFLKNSLTLPDGDEGVDTARFLRDKVMRPTLIYEPLLRPLLDDESLRSAIQGLVHITGGGFYENIPRILPRHTAVTLNRNALPRSPLFERIAEKGALPPREMYSVFNMGVGMVMIAAAESVDRLLAALDESRRQSANLYEQEYRFTPFAEPFAVVGEVVQRATLSEPSADDSDQVRFHG